MTAGRAITLPISPRRTERCTRPPLGGVPPLRILEQNVEAGDFTRPDIRVHFFGSVILGINQEGILPWNQVGEQELTVVVRFCGDVMVRRASGDHRERSDHRHAGRIGHCHITDDGAAALIDQKKD